MRTLTVTMLAATGLFGLAPAAVADRNYSLAVAGQASHLRPALGELEIVRWTVTNNGNRHLDSVRLDTTIPNGWTVKEGPGCAHTGAYLRCNLGPLDAARQASVDVPMVVHRPTGPVQLRAWAGATAGRLNVPGPETSFRVVVVPRR
jgi:hypothetical protein